MEGKMSRTIVNAAGVKVAKVFAAGSSNPLLPTGRCIQFYMTPLALSQVLGMGVREEDSEQPLTSLSRWIESIPAASYVFGGMDAMFQPAALELVK
jgi:hypothetical protein